MAGFHTLANGKYTARRLGPPPRIRMEEATMAQQAPVEVIQRYLEDAIAAEQNFENQLRAFAKESTYENARALFEQHAEVTRTQHERLSARLTALGGKPSGLKSFMANMFGFAPKTAQMGHSEAEKTTQDLIMAYAVENSEVAMYEALAVAASAAGDTATESLAREIQREEQQTARMVWDLIDPIARDSFLRVTSGEQVRRAA
jgi:ferritin-like metal-binding protein YciE